MMPHLNLCSKGYQGDLYDDTFFTYSKVLVPISLLLCSPASVSDVCKANIPPEKVVDCGRGDAHNIPDLHALLLRQPDAVYSVLLRGSPGLYNGLPQCPVAHYRVPCLHPSHHALLESFGETLWDPNMYRLCVDLELSECDPRIFRCK